MVYITRSDVYRVAGIPSDGSIISDNDIDMFIGAAESFVEKEMNTCYQPGGKAVTEVYDGNGKNYMFLNNHPLITLTSVTINSTSVTTSYIYTWDHMGKIQLKSTAEQTIFLDTLPQLVTIVYTYGSEPTEMVRHYTAGVAAMQTLVAQIGGTFDDVTSFSLPEISGNLGEPYTNIREAIMRLEKILPMWKKMIRPTFIAG